MTTEGLWADWPDSDIEAGLWVKEQGIYKGYPDALFYPNSEVTPPHFVVVMDRAGIKAGLPTTTPVTIGDALKYLPNTVVTSKPTDKLTRFRLAVMLYRHFVAPINSDQTIIANLEKWFRETRVTWNNVTRPTKFIGHASLFVKLSREYNVPIWLALGQSWRESQWFTTGLSVNYNCGWGMRDRTGRWGAMGTPTHVRTFTNYVSVEEAINAYYRLMNSPKMPYRALIDKYLAESDPKKAWEHIMEALDIYAPSFENDTVEHHKIVQIIKRQAEQRGIK